MVLYVEHQFIWHSGGSCLIFGRHHHFKFGKVVYKDQSVLISRRGTGKVHGYQLKGLRGGDGHGIIFSVGACGWYSFCTSSRPCVLSVTDGAKEVPPNQWLGPIFPKMATHGIEYSADFQDMQLGDHNFKNISLFRRDSGLPVENFTLPRGRTVLPERDSSTPGWDLVPSVGSVLIPLTQRPLLPPMAHKATGAGWTGVASTSSWLVSTYSPGCSTQGKSIGMSVEFPWPVMYLESKSCQASCTPLLQFPQFCGLQVGQWVVIGKDLNVGPGDWWDTLQTL